MDEALVDYMLAIVERTRSHESLAMGVSPRGAQALYRATQALAAVEGRDYATPDDVKRLVVPVFAHRVVVNTRVAIAQRSAEVGRENPGRNSDTGGRSALTQTQMKTAIVGLPMVGKTSLFTILTGVHEAARVGTLEARVGMTKVPDARLDALAKIFDPPKITHATVEYLDFPAISKEALRDPSYLASLRVVDALAHVLRVFESDTVPHEKGSVDPMRDFEDVEMELILSDLVVVEKRMERVDKDRKKIKNPELDQEFALLEQLKAELEANRPLRGLEFQRRR